MFVLSKHILHLVTAGRVMMSSKMYRLINGRPLMNKDFDQFPIF